MQPFDKIGDRLYSEAKLFVEKSTKKATDTSIAAVLGVPRVTFLGWVKDGRNISNDALAKAYELGLDMQYILTGKRFEENGHLTPKQRDGLSRLGVHIQFLAGLVTELSKDPEFADCVADVLDAADEYVEAVSPKLEDYTKKKNRRNTA